jgi:ribokinase
VVEDRPPAAVTVLASLNLDVCVSAARLPGPGETVLGRSVTHNLGGKGGNQAVALARLGVPVRVIGCLGDDDAGLGYRAALAAEGIDLTWLETQAGVPSGLASIMVGDSGENSIVVVPGANARVGASGRVDFERAAAGAGLVLAQLEVPPGAVAAALRAGRAAGAVTVLNPAPVTPAAVELLAWADVVVPNEVELVALLDALAAEHPPGSPARWDPAVLAQVSAPILAAGPTWLVATLGSAGALAVGPHGRWRHWPAEPVRPVDTTAAGDAFVAGLTAVIVRRADLTPATLDEACELATAVAAHAIRHPGAQPSLPTAAQVGWR